MSKSSYYKENKTTDKNYQLASFYEDDRNAASGSVHFAPCELCDRIQLNPSLNNMSRLLKAKVKLVNCCPGKELTVGCIVKDTSGKILAYKSATFIVPNVGMGSKDIVEILDNDDLIEDTNVSDCGCSGKVANCVDVIRKFKFILPNSDVCSALDVNVKVIANYTSPCS